MSNYKSVNSLALEIMHKREIKENNDTMFAPSTTPVSASNVQGDYEGEMAKIQLSSLANMASELKDSITDTQELEAWVQSKIAVASEMLTGVYNYMKYKK